MRRVKSFIQCQPYALKIGIIERLLSRASLRLTVCPALVRCRIFDAKTKCFWQPVSLCFLKARSTLATLAPTSLAILLQDQPSLPSSATRSRRKMTSGLTAG
jgi:hypothetical protein